MLKGNKPVPVRNKYNLSTGCYLNNKCGNQMCIEKEYNVELGVYQKERKEDEGRKKKVLSYNVVYPPTRIDQCKQCTVSTST